MKAFHFKTLLLVISITMFFICNNSPVIANDKKPPLSVPSKEASDNLMPVVPNESIVQGTVSGYCAVSSRLLKIKPEQVIYKIIVLIESSGNVKNLPNLIKGKEGQDITFYTKEKQSLEILGKRIRARAKYKSSKGGGIYWLNNMEVIK